MRGRSVGTCRWIDAAVATIDALGATTAGVFGVWVCVSFEPAIKAVTGLVGEPFIIHGAWGE